MIVVDVEKGKEEKDDALHRAKKRRDRCIDALMDLREDLNQEYWNTTNPDQIYRAVKKRKKNYPIFNNRIQELQKKVIETRDGRNRFYRSHRIHYECPFETPHGPEIQCGCNLDFNHPQDSREILYYNSEDGEDIGPVCEKCENTPIGGGSAFQHRRFCPRISTSSSSAVPLHSVSFAGSLDWIHDGVQNI